MNESELFETIISEPASNPFDDTECTIEIENRAPRNYEIYIYGVCEFVYDDGTKSIDRQLGRHYHGDSVKWRSNKPLKCVKRVNVALIAKSHQVPDEGKYAIADEAPKDQCIIQRGWIFGETVNVAESTKGFDGRFELIPK